MNERTIMAELNDHPFVVKLHYAFQSVSYRRFNIFIFNFFSHLLNLLNICLI